MKSFLYKTNLFIRSFLFSFISLSVMLIYSLYCVLISFTPLSFRYAAVMRFNKFEIYLLKILCGVKYKIEGLENIPKDRNGVVLSKHQSTWETYMLPTLFHQAAIILKRELLFLPFFGWGLAIVSPIAINRNDRSSAMDQVIQQGTKYLKEGRWILVFPEGTRIPVGKVGKYRLGGARLASLNHAPVLPVAHNAGRFWPKRKFIKQPGTIHLAIGPLIETEGKTPEQVLTEAKNWIENKILEME